MFADWLVAELGERYKDFENKVDGQGRINWLTAGPYSFKWHEEAGRAYISEMKHVGKADLDKVDVIRIDASWKLEQPWDDLRAQFTGGLAHMKPLCIDFVD